MTEQGKARRVFGKTEPDLQTVVSLAAVCAYTGLNL